MSGWSSRNEGFIGPSQLQRLQQPPMRDFNRYPPPLPPPQHYPQQQQVYARPPPVPQQKRNSFFSSLKNIGMAHTPVPAPSPGQMPGYIDPSGSAQQHRRNQSSQGNSLPSSQSMPIVSAPHALQPRQQQIGPAPSPPRTTMEKAASASRQASGALSDHGHGGSPTMLDNGTVNGNISAAMGNGHAPSRVLGNVDTRRSSMINLPMPQSSSEVDLAQLQQQHQRTPTLVPDRPSLDTRTATTSSSHATPTTPTAGQASPMPENPLATLHPELRSGIGLQVAHAHKVYYSGPLARRLELEPNGRPPHRQEGWLEVWAQLGGTTLSVWDMKAIEEASKRGEEVPPSYINVTDAFIGVLGSIEIPATATQPASRRTNILTLNTAGSNLLLFSAPNGPALVSWAAALRLATWEKSRLEEIYTGHLLRMSLTMPNGDFKQPKTALTRGKLEGWVRVRLAGQVDWKRVYAIITSAYDPLQSPNIPGRPSAIPPSAFAAQLGGTRGQARPESPTSQKAASVLTKRRMSGLFRSGSSSALPPSQGTGANAASSTAYPNITLHAAPPQGRRPKPPLLTLTRVTQAFALYPERPEMISKSNLFKLECVLGMELLDSVPAKARKNGEKGAGKAEERFAGKMAGREGWVILQPEMEEPGAAPQQGGPQKGSLVMEMLKWLVAIHDAFGLYGRPAGYTWDPREPISMMFSYPVGPMRDHLFLDRELAEGLDPNEDRTSAVRARLLSILLERMRGPPGGSVSSHSQAQDDEEGVSVELQRSAGTGGAQGPAQMGNMGPQLPPLAFPSFDEREYIQNMDDDVGQRGAPTSYNPSGVRRTHSMLTKITEQSTVRGDSGETETRQNSAGERTGSLGGANEFGERFGGSLTGSGSGSRAGRDRSMSRQSAFTENMDEFAEGYPGEQDDDDEYGDEGEPTEHYDDRPRDKEDASAEADTGSGSEPTIIAGARVMKSPDVLPEPQPPQGQGRAPSPYAVSNTQAHNSSPLTVPPAVGLRAPSPYAFPTIGTPGSAGRTANTYAQPSVQTPGSLRGGTPYATAPIGRSPLANGGEPKDYPFPAVAETSSQGSGAAAGLHPGGMSFPQNPSTEELPPPRPVITTPPPSSPKLRSPGLPTRMVSSPLGPPPAPIFAPSAPSPRMSVPPLVRETPPVPQVSPPLYQPPPPIQEPSRTPRMTPEQLPSIQTVGLKPPVPPAAAGSKALPPAPELPDEPPFTDSPASSRSPSQPSHSYPPMPAAVAGIRTSQGSTVATSPASGSEYPPTYPPTEAHVSPPAERSSVEEPMPRRQLTPINFDRFATAGGGGAATRQDALHPSTTGPYLGRKPSGARDMRPSSRPSDLPPPATSDRSSPLPAAPAQAPAPPEAPAQPAQSPASTMPARTDSMDDFGDDALAALTYMQFGGSPQKTTTAQHFQRHQRPPVTPPRAQAAPEVDRVSPESPLSPEPVPFPSSFAASKQASERKAKMQVQQQRRDEAVHKPGRPTTGTRLVKSTWDRSSDEEDEDEEDEDEASDDEAAMRGRQATAVRPPRDASLLQEIHAPLPQPVQTPATRFEIEAPSPPRDPRTTLLPGDAQRQSRYAVPVAGRASPGVAMGMEGPSQPPQPMDSERYDAGGYRPVPVPGQYEDPPRMRQSYYPDDQRPPSQSRSRERYDSRERPPAQNRQSVWASALERDDGMPAVQPQTNRNTFINLDPSETMTKAFSPHGLLQAGIQDKHDRSAKRQEELARESGASLINVPSKPPPPQIGLLGAITAHERERNREGGMGATLTEREREKRIAEERQRRLDDYQRQQLEQQQAMSQGAGQYDMYQNQQFGGFNPMGGGMLHPMMTGMMGNPMMMGGYGMNPMMFGGMMPYGGGWGGNITAQQQQLAAQAAMEAYQRTMMTYSQAGSVPQSPAASDVGQQSTSPQPVNNRMSTASPVMSSPWMGGMGGMPMMGMMPGMMPNMGMMGMGGMGGGMGMSPMGSMANLSGMNSPNFNPQQQGQPNDYLSANNRYSSFTASETPPSRPLSGTIPGDHSPAGPSDANTPN